MIDPQKLGPAVPFVISRTHPLIVYRHWTIRNGRNLTAGRLGHAWILSDQRAVCKPGVVKPDLHAHPRNSPAKNCACGFWGFRFRNEAPDLHRIGAGVPVMGVAAFWGSVYFHPESGLIRAHSARPLALLIERDTPLLHAPLDALRTFQTKTSLGNWIKVQKRSRIVPHREQPGIFTVNHFDLAGEAPMKDQDQDQDHHILRVSSFAEVHVTPDGPHGPTVAYYRGQSSPEMIQAMTVPQARELASTIHRACDHAEGLDRRWEQDQADLELGRKVREITHE